MANKKFEINAKPKAAPAATSSEKGQKTKTSKSKASATPELVAPEKVEKGKKAQAVKKGSKGQQMLIKPIEDQSKASTEMQTTVPSKTKVNRGEAKDRKEKEAKAKVKKKAVVEPVATEPIATEPVTAEAPVSKKVTLEPTSEKATKMKRLTLDIAKPLHKAIKAKAVEEGVPMVDMLRSLLEEHYSK